MEGTLVMRAAGAFGGGPRWAHEKMRGACRNGRGKRARGQPQGSHVQLPMWPRSVCGLRRNTWAMWTQAGCADGTFGCTPIWPRNVRGVCRNRRRERMRTASLGPSVGLHMGQRSV
eukprot:9503105-Pyramimonas_sp.AAC.1